MRRKTASHQHVQRYGLVLALHEDALAVYRHSFALLLAGTFLTGIYNAFGQYYRFAAADAAPPDWKSVLAVAEENARAAGRIARTRYEQELQGQDIDALVVAYDFEDYGAPMDAKPPAADEVLTVDEARERYQQSVNSPNPG